MTLLEVKNLKKIYTTRFGGNQVQALSNVNFSVEEKEYVAIMGESGSGKTTLLNILAALDKPTSGKVYLKGRDLGEIRNKEMAAFRRQNLGFADFFRGVSGFQSSGYIFSGGQYLSSDGTFRQKVSGDESETQTNCTAAWNHSTFEEVSI